MVCTICSPIAFNITGIKILFFDLYLGNLKDIVLTYIGFIFFDDTILTMMVATGLVLSFMGAGSYALDSYLKER